MDGGWTSTIRLINDCFRSFLNDFPWGCSLELFRTYFALVRIRLEESGVLLFFFSLRICVKHVPRAFCLSRLSLKKKVLLKDSP